MQNRILTCFILVAFVALTGVAMAQPTRDGSGLALLASGGNTKIIAAHTPTLVATVEPRASPAITTAAISFANHGKRHVIGHNQ